MSIIKYDIWYGQMLCYNYVILTFIYTIVKPAFTEHPEAMNVSIMIDDIELQATAVGYPIPEIKWIHNSRTVNESENERVNISVSIEADERSVTSVLIIYDTALADSGWYYSVATNIDAYEPTNSTSVLVLVQGMNFYF